MMSYGLPLLGLVALAVLARGPVVAAAADRRPVARSPWCWSFAAGGFVWWEAYPVLHDRYWDGIAADRPAAYWLWGNLAALVVCAGPLLGAGLAAAGGAAAGGPIGWCCCWSRPPPPRCCSPTCPG